MRWINQGRGPVPIEFQKLVDATLDDPVLIAAIRDLVSAKMAGAGLDQGPRIPAISDFITVEMTRLEQTTYGRPDAAPEVAKLNELFRVMLYECWNGSS
jgi:predicted nucleotidyltransferase